MFVAFLAALFAADLDEVAAMGPFAVGSRTVEFVDESRGGRRLRTEFWYPCSTIEGAEPDSIALKGTTPECRNAPVIDGRHPLILFSHGLGATRVQSTFLTSHWASHGYLVVAPDHPGSTTTDPGDRYQSAIDRPVDMSFLLDALLDGQAPASIADVCTAIDPERIGMAGHSFGGYTAIVMAGAVVDTQAAAKAYNRTVTEKEYKHPDPRPKAFLAYAPPGPPIFKVDSLRTIRRPVMVFGGTNDQILQYRQHQESLFRGLSSPSYLASLEGGGHFSFNDSRFLAMVALVKPKRKIEEHIDRSQADPLVRAVSLSFLDRHVGNRPVMESLLLESRPGLRLETRLDEVRPAGL